MSPSPAIENYTEVSGMSDLNMDDLYSMRKAPILSANQGPAFPSGPLPSIPEQGAEMGNPQMGTPQMDSLLQAQLAMLHPIQKFQFLQQQIKNHQKTSRNISVSEQKF